MSLTVRIPMKEICYDDRWLTLMQWCEETLSDLPMWRNLSESYLAHYGARLEHEYMLLYFRNEQDKMWFQLKWL